MAHRHRFGDRTATAQQVADREGAISGRIRVLQREELREASPDFALGKVPGLTDRRLTSAWRWSLAKVQQVRDGVVHAYRQANAVWALKRPIVIALLVALGYGAFVLGRMATDAVRDRIAKPVPVHPVSVHASSEAPGHPAAWAADGLSNRYWAPAPTGPAQGEYVEFTFAGPMRLLDLIVHSGAAPEQDVFLGQARPAELELTAWTAGGAQVHTTLSLEDRPGEQKLHQVIGDVVRIRLTIKSSYASAPQRRVALGEVEFFKRP